MVGVCNVFNDPFFKFQLHTGYSILKLVIMQVLFRHNLIVFQGAITIFVGLQALCVSSLMKF